MSPTVDRTPVYQQIFEHFRGKILRGELPDGAKLPSTREMCAEWGIALNTVARVLQLLRAEGLVESRPGVGTTVTVNRHEAPSEQVVNGRTTGKVYPKGHRAVIVSAKLLPASEQVADAVGVEAGTQVIGRTRIHFDAQKVALSVSTSYFRGEFAETAPALLTTKRLPGGTLAYIEKRTGLRAVSGVDQYAARAAGPIEAGQLKIPEGSPVLAIRNWWRAADGTVLEYGEAVSLPGRWRSHEYRLAAVED